MSLRNNTEGASLLEFALILPLLLCLVTFFIDTALVFIATSSLEYCARQAIILAEVIPGLEDDVIRGGRGGSNSAEKRVLLRMLQTLDELKVEGPLISFAPKKFVANVLPSLHFPRSHAPRKAVLEQQPVELRVHGTLSSRLPFFRGKELRVVLRSFREPSSHTTQIPLLDCAGIEVTEFQHTFTCD